MKTYAAAFHSTFSSVLFVNSFAVRCDGVLPGAPDLGAGTVADEVSTWLTTAYRAMLPAAYSVSDVSVRELYTSTPAQGVHAISAAGTLSGSSGNLPREVCLILSLKSAVATRSGRGRMFIPSPLNSGFLSSQDVWDTASAYWSAVNTFGNALLAGRTFTSGVLDYHLSCRIHSRTRNEDYDLTSFVRRPQPHWLRSRATAP